MKKLVVLLCFVSWVSFSQENVLFSKANALYRKGQYNGAVELYQTILKRELHSAELYYNMANAHYKLNHIGESIYYYEKALRLAPGDSDILNNLSYAKNQRIDKIAEIPLSIFDKLALALEAVSVNTWGWSAIAFSLLTVVLFLIYYTCSKQVFKKISFLGALFAFLLCITTFLFGYFINKNNANRQYAIIMSSECPMREEPNMAGKSEITLHEGTKVEILERLDNWVKVSIANGKIGWVSFEPLRKI